MTAHTSFMRVFQSGTHYSHHSHHSPLKQGGQSILLNDTKY